jgi:hypothetical protein
MYLLEIWTLNSHFGKFWPVIHEDKIRYNIHKDCGWFMVLNATSQRL